MRKILYVSYSTNMTWKKDAVLKIFAKISTLTPTWDYTRNLLKWPTFQVAIYDGDENAHRGILYDYSLESFGGATPALLSASNPRMKYIDNNLNCPSMLNINEVIDDILGFSARPKLPSTLVIDKVDNKIEDIPKTGCDHTWKYYEGLKEAFTFCEKCDKVKI